ncbi:MAG: cyclic nucleotide-binding domain-containing protein [Nitrospinaceae bacterium]
MTAQDPKEIIKLLDGIPLFRGLNEKEKKSLADLKAVVVRHKTEEKIITQGDIDLRLFVLLKGNVVVAKNENPNKILARLNRGDIFGEVSFISKRPRMANVIADGEAYILRLDGEQFETLPIGVQNKLREHLIDLLVRRLDVMNTNILPFLRYH